MDSNICGVVSCDIVAHSLSSVEVQGQRLQAINTVIDNIMNRNPSETVWASSGDGGHEIFLSREWLTDAIDLIFQLHMWGQRNAPLRLTAHADSISGIRRLQGADGRVQLAHELVG